MKTGTMQEKRRYSTRLGTAFRLLCIAVLIFSAGCQRNLTTISSTTPEQAPENSVVAPATLSDDAGHPVYQNLRNPTVVFTFYSNRQFQPFWLEKNELSKKAKAMMDQISSARRYGFLPQNYHAREIGQSAIAADQLTLMRVDVLLTDAFLSMAKDLNNGRSNRRENARADSIKVVNLIDSLSILSVDAVLEAQEPIFDEYKKLKMALNDILDSAASDNQTLLLKGVTRDSSEIFRIVQAIEVNLERWRMETASLDGTYAWVNIPAYMMYVMENDKIALESRVIVGKRGNETPRFSSDIECFTVFPYWYVPRKISVQEYLPIIRKDTTFLSRNNFDVLDRSGKIQDHSLIDWRKLTPGNFPYTLRQREGKENSLGVLKFVFDNPYAVFVHDTNAKRLFKNTMRALSHGCIRMEKAYEFAHYLVSARSKITNEMLDKYLKTDKKATVSLVPSVPIHIRYFTCDVRNEKLTLYEDIYREDRKLILKLYNDEEFY